MDNEINELRIENAILKTRLEAHIESTKTALDLADRLYQERHRVLETQVENLKEIIWKGLGAISLFLIILGIIIPIFIHFFG